MPSISRLSLVLIPLCLLSILGCVTEPEFDMIYIHVQGAVTYKATGNPVNSAKIILYEYFDPRPVPDRKRLISLETYTTPSGLYEIRAKIPVLPNGYELVLSVSKAGYLKHGREIEWGVDIQTLNFQLSPVGEIP